MAAGAPCAGGRDDHLQPCERIDPDLVTHAAM
jgi:hypothetical protein